MIRGGVILLLLGIALTGCSHSDRPALDRLYAQAETRLNHGDLPEAFRMAEEGRIESEKSDASWNWRFRILVADVHLWQGRFNEALAILENGPLSALSAESAARRRLIQCRALYSLHAPEKADSCLAEAERLIEDAPAFKGEFLLAKVTQLYYLDKPKKLPEIHRILHLTLDFARLNKDQFLEAKTLGTFGLVDARAALYDDALDSLRPGLALSRALGARHIEAGILLNTGWCYLELGDFTQAGPLLQNAVELSAGAGLSRTQEYALNNLGRLHSYYADDFKAAIDYYTRALAIARDRGGDNVYIGQYLNNISSTNLMIGQFPEAEKSGQEALDYLKNGKDHKEVLWALLNQAEIATATKNYTGAEAQFLAIIEAPDAPVAMRWEAQAGLARYYVATHQTARARAQFRQALNTLDQARKPIRDEENRLAFSFWEATFHTDYIRFLIDERDIQGALLVAESMQARDLEEGLAKSGRPQHALSIPAIRSYLKKQNQVILSYWLTPTQSYLWAITPGEIRLFQLPPRREIEAKVERYQKAITDLEDVEQGDQGGQELFQMLVEPARRMIPAGAHVVVIPDGGLARLNFETLIAPGPPPHFWIRDVELENASSISLLIRPRIPAPTTKKLLLMGDPIQASPDYPALTFARNEIEKISTHFSPSEELTISGKDARPSTYGAVEPGRFEIIDFVTHGVASDIRPLDSAIILSSQEGGAFKLYAGDILRKRLNARIVIVSACYGAGKRSYSAAGLVGLAWAFLRAGAHQVIAGSWKVDDRSTPEFMDDFYTELKSGKSPSKALRSAKLRMLNSGTVYRLPNFWAALQIYTGS